MVTNGPIRKSANIGYTTDSYATATNTELFMGAVTFKNTTKSDFEIISVKPTNIPKGVSFISSGFIKGQPVGGAGPVDLVKTKFHPNFVSDKVTVPVSSSTVYEPDLFIKIEKSGTYVIQGLLIKYVWGGKTYIDYIPEQFILCATDGTVPGTCSADGISPPPTTWELH